MADGLIRVTRTGAPASSSSIRSASVRPFTACFEAGVRTLQDISPVAQHASHVDDLATTQAQMFGGHKASMQDTKVVGVEEPAMIVERDLLDGAEDGHAGIVDPSVEAAELLLAFLATRSLSSKRPTSAATAMALVPWASQSRARSCKAASFRDTRTSLAPRSAKARVVARPMPLDALVRTPALRRA
jgi:hypothetical protein